MPLGQEMILEDLPQQLLKTGKILWNISESFSKKRKRLIKIENASHKKAKRVGLLSPASRFTFLQSPQIKYITILEPGGCPQQRLGQYLKFFYY